MANFGGPNTEVAMAMINVEKIASGITERAGAGDWEGVIDGLHRITTVVRKIRVISSEQYSKRKVDK